MSTDAIRKARSRERRKKAGLVEVRAWVGPITSEYIDSVAKAARISRADAVAAALTYSRLNDRAKEKADDPTQ